jgi:hypothetical protein
MVDSESADADSARRRRIQVNNLSQPTDDHMFRNTQQFYNLKEAANALSSQRSSGQRSSSNHNGYGGELSDENDNLLEQVSVLDPQQHLIKDLRNLKINEKSEDTGSLQTVTPKDNHFKSGEQSKITSPVDNNASYIDKSMTRQFEHLVQTPTLSKNTGDS